MEMNIYEAIASIMQKGNAIGKNKRNDQQKFMYRGIDDVMNVFNPLMAEAGIFMVPEVLEASREERQGRTGGNLIYSILRVKYTFYAADGTSVSATVIGEGMDSGDKASNKAMAVAMKYAMFQVFCIPTEEMKDPDAETPEPSVPVTVPRPAEKVVELPKRREPVAGPDGYYKCEGCGTVIKARGKMTDYGVAEMSLKEFGRQLCYDCGHKAYLERSGK